MADKIDRDNYCKDCKRSIYGEYKDCDCNIENNGKYDGPPNEECPCKVKAEVVTHGNCMICGKELTDGLFICKECEEKYMKVRMRNDKNINNNL